ncbi:glycosyltransferase family 2 protein [Balneola sp. MJW-20]|uniref:glycosyltransferase family 2 protein n=1 Tax=Gracilimonas aurantiaca TaxID=3234185 RepID=UPI0034654B47
MMSTTAIIINFQTPDLTETAVRSFKELYPEIPVILADNGSSDTESRKLITALSSELPQVSTYYFDKNIYHGPAMDHLITSEVKSDQVFLLDSDTETHTGGFLEKMSDLLENDLVYGAGRVQLVNKRGFKSDAGFPILLTPYMLLKTKLYRKLPPFVHHGQPTLFNFKEASASGYKLSDFPIQDYIDHKWRGTADRFGYGLNWKAKLDYILNKVGL